MLERFIEKGTKTVDTKQYAYEVKSLSLDEEANPPELLIEPFSALAATKIAKLFALINKFANYDPETANEPKYSYEQQEKFIVVRASKDGIKRAVRLLTDNSFISLDTSRKLTAKLEAFNTTELKAADERTPLLVRVPVK
jgi:hypothetical protein